uniref:Acyl-CoA_dh_N domain-containing protein n=1 Tax=Rhabditophanes sp. KR3021 TaxID=114890 RepID=A0AC35TLL0_9BILA
MLRQSFKLNGLSKNIHLVGRFLSTDQSMPVIKEKTEVVQTSLGALKAAIEEAKLPVEKYSLTRGLSSNKFEKDFFIFPEFNETEDVDEIKQYCTKFRNDLEESLRCTHEDDDVLPGETITALLKNDVLRTFVPKEFGGLAFCQKSQLKLFEVLGLDFSVFQIVNNTRLAIQLLNIYGTEEQKEKYLPSIAENLCQPAICLFEEEEFDFANMNTEAHGISNENAKISGRKINVVNGRTADLFFVIAKKKMHSGESTINCYIIDKKNLNGGSIKIEKSKPLLGLQCVEYSTIKFQDVAVTNDNILSESLDDSNGVLHEIMYRNKLQFGACVVGFMKNLVRDLSLYCNSTVRGNKRLADKPAIQKIIADVSMNLYALETACYYIGGLVDENLMVLTDIEENIINRMTARVLKHTLTTTIEVAGLSNANGYMNKEKVCKDILTLLAMNNAEMNLVEQISLTTIQSWAKSQHINKITKTLSPLKALRLAKSVGDFKSPKPIHYIAEHVHPSLQVACKSLEDTMARINMVIDKIVKEEGKNLQGDYFTLQSLANIIESNMVMSSCIARASRSYSIGLRNSDLELAWTNYYCTNESKKNEIEMEALLDYLGFIRINPTFANIGAAVLDSGKYLIESPIERNW